MSSPKSPSVAKHVCNPYQDGKKNVCPHNANFAVKWRRKNWNNCFAPHTRMILVCHGRLTIRRHVHRPMKVLVRVMPIQIQTHMKHSLKYEHIKCVKLSCWPQPSHLSERTAVQTFWHRGRCVWTGLGCGLSKSNSLLQSAWWVGGRFEVEKSRRPTHPPLEEKTSGKQEWTLCPEMNASFLNMSINDSSMNKFSFTVKLSVLATTKSSEWTHCSANFLTSGAMRLDTPFLLSIASHELAFQQLKASWSFHRLITTSSQHRVVKLP